ncbi:MAG TPA: hypothetical protein VFA63_18685 [Pseudonocardiaceae bacterium]|nr:hypothetical protein [Pseudonocardiaceae bacterium]
MLGGVVEAFGQIDSQQRDRDRHACYGYGAHTEPASAADDVPEAG